MKKVLILGAAGRDFHNFNVVFRNNPEFHIVAFTATQIPDIDGRRYPAELAGELYPDGIPILDENKMEEIIREEQVDVVVFSYSDVAYPTLMHLASRAVAAGADFWLLGAARTQLAAKVPVISVCAVRTGCGKSPVSRRIATDLRQMGWNPVVVRHPMPYGDLAEQRAQRFGSLADLDRYQCTIEEREEYEPHIIEGTTSTPAWITKTILRQAEKEGDVILWDGGNNDTSFYRPDLDIVVLDPHRPGHELAYYPGEVNFRTAHVLIINKVDTADPDGVKTVRQNIALHNPKAKVIETACTVTIDDPERFAANACWWSRTVRRSPTVRCPTGPEWWQPIATTRLRWSIRVRLRSAPSRRRSRSFRTCGGSCPPWDTANGSGTNWKRPSSAFRATW